MMFFDHRVSCTVARSQDFFSETETLSKTDADVETWDEPNLTTCLHGPQCRPY